MAPGAEVTLIERSSFEGMLQAVETLVFSPLSTSKIRRLYPALMAQIEASRIIPSTSMHDPAINPG